MLEWHCKEGKGGVSEVRNGDGEGRKNMEKVGGGFGAGTCCLPQPRSTRRRHQGARWRR